MTTPYSLSSVMPVSKPPRPGWVVPVIIALAVVALAALGLAVWALVRPAATQPAAVTAAATTITPGAVLPLGGPAADACHSMQYADPSNLVAMQSVGAKAMTVEDNDDIRIDGALLHDFAQLAIAADGQPDSQELRGEVDGAARTFRATCVKQHYLAS